MASGGFVFCRTFRKNLKPRTAAYFRKAAEHFGGPFKSFMRKLKIWIDGKTAELYPLAGQFAYLQTGSHLREDMPSVRHKLGISPRR